MQGGRIAIAMRPLGHILVVHLMVPEGQVSQSRQKSFFVAAAGFAADFTAVARFAADFGPMARATTTELAGVHLGSSWKAGCVYICMVYNAATSGKYR